ncbi:hypothetical protein [Arthrobacter polaris]|uniref:hypothetical protein n=1 Tax=Arthrobacter polaris TaxID=2813727 RepID=UPI001F24FC1B|nr:hypothetical protein [Arthrobacter polaris]UIK88931.1 hypothetical protein J0916_17005 [Arthrobacter polaris]
MATPKDLDVHSQMVSYGTIGNVFRVDFTGLRALYNLMQDDSPIAQPAKELALNLMRKGPSMYARFHNDHLADALFTALTNRT